jgi:hypothetical protein
MNVDYGYHQKPFLEDRIRNYQRAGLWDRGNEAWWDLLKLELKDTLDRGFVKTNASESHERYASRCVQNWRSLNVDNYIPLMAA